MKKIIIAIALLNGVIQTTKAQMVFYPEFAYGIANAKASGSFDPFGSYPIDHVSSKAYFHIGIMGNFKIPKSPNLFISTGLLKQEYTIKFYFQRTIAGGTVTYLASSREGTSFTSIPLLLNYAFTPQKKQTLVATAGVIYGFSTSPLIKNALTADLGIGYKYGAFNTKLFYTANLNQLYKNPSIQQIKFNSLALSIAYRMYAGRNKTTLNK